VLVADRGHDQQARHRGEEGERPERPREGQADARGEAAIGCQQSDQYPRHVHDLDRYQHR